MSNYNKSNKNKGIVRKALDEIIQPFRDLFHAPRALWGVNISYLIEGLTYFGVVGLLAIFFNRFVGLDDIQAGRMVGFLTAGITISMLVLGATVDLIGVRKALLWSLLFMFIGRVILAAVPDISNSTGAWSSAHIISFAGMLGIIVGYGIYMPACYTATKKFTTKKTSAMGYAMLYALMNLGGFLPGIISPPIRKAFGITGVFWVFSVLTIIGMAFVAFFITKKAIKEATQTTDNIEDNSTSDKPKEPLIKRIEYYLKRFPITDYRFMFFIFMLIPVQTLFAHNWLTLPQYCERAFTGVVSDNFEFFVNFNPILIFILTPIIAALTAQKRVYSMMLWGTFIMASSPFLLIIGPNIYVLFTYIIIMTIGEAIWQPRFLQWVAELAPKDMTGIYMGLGQFPWFLTKVITSIYSGWFLMNYCPQGLKPDQMNTETMWLIYALIAMISPFGLLLARKWMTKGFKTKHNEENN